MIVEFAAHHVFDLTEDATVCAAASVLERGFALTALDPEGRAIAAAGVVDLWPGVGEAWFFGTAAMNRRDVARRVRAFMNGQSRYVRIQAACRSDNVRALRFAFWLGMSPEGDMPLYGPDRATYTRFARLYPR